MSENDELMDDLPIPEIHEVFFQFDEEDPVRMAFVAGGEFSLTLKAETVDNPSVEFTDGKGRIFRIFLKKTEDGI